VFETPVHVHISYTLLRIYRDLLLRRIVGNKKNFSRNGTPATCMCGYIQTAIEQTQLSYSNYAITHYLRMNPTKKCARLFDLFSSALSTVLVHLSSQECTSLFRRDVAVLGVPLILLLIKLCKLCNKKKQAENVDTANEVEQETKKEETSKIETEVITLTGRIVELITRMLIYKFNYVLFFTTICFI
jgi:hypothetical protein